MDHQRRDASMNATDRRAIIRVLRLSPIVAEIQQTLDSRRGRHLSVSVEAALFALIAAAGKGAGHAARMHRCAALLREGNYADPAGLPTDLLNQLGRTEDPEQRRLLMRNFYRRMLRTLDAIGKWGTGTTDNIANIDRLAHTLLLASVPVAVRAYRSHAFDSAGVQASRRRPPYDGGNNPDRTDTTNDNEETGRKKRQDLDRTQAAMRYRTYTTDDGDPIKKELYGYSLHLDARVDPTGNDPTLWIGGLKLTPGNVSEPVTAADLLRLDARLRNPVVDLVIGDRGYSQSTTLRAAIHDMHGDLVMDLNNYHEHPFRHPSGIWIFHGAAYDPATPPDLFRLRRRKQHEPINAWLTERDRSLGAYRLKLHTQPDIHGTFRVVGNCVRSGVNCSIRPDLGKPGQPIYPTLPVAGPTYNICKGKTVQLDRNEFTIPRSNRTDGIPTYQPLPYGSREHAAVYGPWRSRTEGALGTLTGHHGLWGGHRGFLAANFDVIQLFVIAAGVAYNLTRQGHFPADHGTKDMSNDAVLNMPAEATAALQRLLKSRTRVRDQFDPSTCPHHDHPTPTPILAGSANDPPC
ncbi:MAG: hypothetical protein EA388_09160 [Nitriliruptor sp.]|nr:MAG: hypothetical protein EA388_09160 [Nitriliruptor sp.]